MVFPLERSLQNVTVRTSPTTLDPYLAVALGAGLIRPQLKLMISGPDMFSYQLMISGPDMFSYQLMISGPDMFSYQLMIYFNFISAYDMF